MKMATNLGVCEPRRIDTGRVGGTGSVALMLARQWYGTIISISLPANLLSNASVYQYCESARVRYKLASLAGQVYLLFF